MWSHLKNKSIILPKITTEKIDKQLEPILRKMEKRGILLDVDLIKKLDAKLSKKNALLESQIKKQSGEDFNVNSPTQMADVLFGKLKLPTEGLKKTKTGISTAAAELDKISDHHPVIRTILEYRELSKLLSTYLKPLPLMVDKENRLHTSYGQDTSTGRLSSIDPNLQNIPIRGDVGPEIRKAFIAAPGMVLISADYSQIELRVVACLAEDPAMIEAFKKGEDIHTRTASEIFEIKPEKVTSAQRRVAKSVNFGIVYGQSPYGLSQALKIDQHKAAEYIYRYFDIHKGIKNYINSVIAKAHKDGYVETLFGYKRSLPNINSTIYPQREGEERMAINTPVQGTAAEILKLAMIKLEKALKESAPNAQMLLTVHDELVVEAPRAEAKQVAKLMRDVMENIVSLCVPIDVDVESGSNWGELRKII